MRITRQLAAACVSLTLSVATFAQSHQHIPSTSGIGLYHKHGRVLARISTSWVKQHEGDIFFNWVPPKHTLCISTKFPIKEYKSSYDITWASRPIKPLNHFLKGYNKPCYGQWQVKITDRTGKVLAEKSILINR